MCKKRRERGNGRSRRFVRRLPWQLRAKKRQRTTGWGAGGINWDGTYYSCTKILHFFLIQASSVPASQSFAVSLSIVHSVQALIHTSSPARKMALSLLWSSWRLVILVFLATSLLFLTTFNINLFNHQSRHCIIGGSLNGIGHDEPDSYGFEGLSGLSKRDICNDTFSGRVSQTCNPSQTLCCKKHRTFPELCSCN